MYRGAPRSGSVEDLAPGDHLLSLGGVGFPELRDPAAPPVLVADVRPPLEDHDPDEGIAEVITSASVMYARLTAPVQFSRDDTVRPETILLISRRRSLHASLLVHGVPVIRRTPVDDGRTVPAVTAQEWNRAPLIVIDGYLAQQTLRAMWSRDGLCERDQIVMVSDDPDDARVYGRTQAAKASVLFVMPYDTGGLVDLFNAAARTGLSDNPWHGVLTPRITGSETSS